MTKLVEQIADQVRKLDRQQYEELLSWLAERDLSDNDAWDAELDRDSQPGGRLAALIERARRDISEGRTKPLDEFLHDA